MIEKVQHIKSISQLLEMGGFAKPSHPLISIIDTAEIEIPEEYVGLRTSSNLYVIGLKDKSCGLQYGRNSYDFDEGVLFFLRLIKYIQLPKLKNAVRLMVG